MSYIRVSHSTLQKTLVLCFLIASMVTSVWSAQKDDVYLYHFSRENNALVIRTATGSNSRMLPLGVRQPDRNISLEGPGWSFSGKWFAAKIIEVSPQGLPGESIGMFYTNRDLDTVVDLFEGRDISQIDLHWSPVGDLLLITYLLVGQSAADTKDNILIINVETGKRVLEREWPAETFLLDADWLPNGAILLYHHQQGGGHGMQIMDTTGVILTERQIDLPALCDFSRPYWSSQGWVVYPSIENSTIVVDYPTVDIMHDFEMPVSRLQYVEWSPDGNYALIYVGENCDAIPQLWLFSVSDGNIRLLLEAAQPRLELIVPVGSATWSVDSRLALLEAAASEVHVFDVETLNIHTINGIPRGNTLHSGWIDDERVVFDRVVDHNNALYSYDVAEAKLTQLGTGFAVSSISISSDGRYIASSNIDTVFFDTHTQNNVTLQMQAESGEVLYFTERFDWHPSKNWLFLISDYAGTSAVERQINIVQSDGQFQQDLGRCFVSPSCFGWLPDVSQ